MSEISSASVSLSSIENSSIGNIAQASIDSISSSEPVDLQYHLLRSADTTQPEPHKWFYIGSVLLVLGLYFIFICLCKWWRNRKARKQTKTQLVEEKGDLNKNKQEQANTMDPTIQANPESNKQMKEIQLVEMP